MDAIEMLEHRRYAMSEHAEWQTMFKAINEFIPGDLNDSKYYPLFNAIAAWGDEYAKLRAYQVEAGRTEIDKIKMLRFGS